MLGARPGNVDAYPPAPNTVERSGDLLQYDLTAFLGRRKTLKRQRQISLLNNYRT